MRKRPTFFDGPKVAQQSHKCGSMSQKIAGGGQWKSSFVLVCGPYKLYSVLDVEAFIGIVRCHWALRREPNPEGKGGCKIRVLHGSLENWDQMGVVWEKNSTSGVCSHRESTVLTTNLKLGGGGFDYPPPSSSCAQFNRPKSKKQSAKRESWSQKTPQGWRVIKGIKSQKSSP